MVLSRIVLKEGASDSFLLFTFDWLVFGWLIFGWFLFGWFVGLVIFLRFDNLRFSSETTTKERKDLVLLLAALLQSHLLLVFLRRLFRCLFFLGGLFDYGVGCD